MQLFYALRAEHAKIFLLARTWPPSLLVQCHRDADRTVKRQMRKVVPNSAETVFFRDCLLRTPGRSSRDPGCTLSPVITIAMLAFCNLKNPYRSFIVQAVFRTPVCRQRPSAQRFPPPVFIESLSCGVTHVSSLATHLQRARPTLIMRLLPDAVVSDASDCSLARPQGWAIFSSPYESG